MYSMQQKRLSPMQKVKSITNLTGIPTQMKLDFEHRSGLSFDDVRVHYNSDKPAQIGALAYTWGNQVYVGPDQIKHLPHELGHVVQQKLGVVRPNTSVRGIPVNNAPQLEHGADSIANTDRSTIPYHFGAYQIPGQIQSPVVQMIPFDNIDIEKHEYLGKPIGKKVYKLIINVEQDSKLQEQIRLAQAYASVAESRTERVAMLFHYVSSKIPKNEQKRDAIYKPTGEEDGNHNAIYSAYLGECLTNAAACRELAIFLQILYAIEGVKTKYQVGTLSISKRGQTSSFRHAWLKLGDTIDDTIDAPIIDPAQNMIYTGASSQYTVDTDVKWNCATPRIDQITDKTKDINIQEIQELAITSPRLKEPSWFRRWLCCEQTGDLALSGNIALEQARKDSRLGAQ